MGDLGDEPEARRGQLHGNWLRALAVVAAATAVVAAWQYSALSGGDDDPSSLGPLEEAETAPISSASPSEPAADSAEAGSRRLVPSPESSEAETEPEPSSEEPESDAAPPESESPEEPEPAAACTARLELEGHWNGWIEVEVEVVNSGDVEFNSWEVVIDVDDVDIAFHWGMRHLDGDRYGNEDWNGRLAPGQEAEAAFQAEVSHGWELPETVPCTAFE